MKNNHCDYHRHNPEIMIIMIMLLRVGTRRYMAPEILDNTLKLDSFESFKVSFKMIYVDNIIVMSTTIIIVIIIVIIILTLLTIKL